MLTNNESKIVFKQNNRTQELSYDYLIFATDPVTLRKTFKQQRNIKKI